MKAKEINWQKMKEINGVIMMFSLLQKLEEHFGQLSFVDKAIVFQHEKYALSLSWEIDEETCQPLFILEAAHLLPFNNQEQEEGEKPQRIVVQDTYGSAAILNGMSFFADIIITRVRMVAETMTETLQDEMFTNKDEGDEDNED